MTKTGGRTRSWHHRLGRAAPYGAVMAAGAWLYRVAGQFAFERDPGRIGPDVWPKLILILMMASAFWGFCAAVTTRDPLDGATAALDDEVVFPPEIHPSFVWIGIAATFVYLLALPDLGFLSATALYAALLIRLGQYRNLPHILILGPALSLFFVFLFMRVVYVALPIGIGPFGRLSLAAMAAMGVH